MRIDIPQEQYDRLAEKAHASGFDDVAAFIKALAEEPVDPRLPLSEDEMQQSLESLSRSEADLAAGRVRDFREAMLDIAQRNGLRADS